MVRQIKSNLQLFITLVLLTFAMHFIAGMICRSKPDPKVSERFDAYLKPGVFVLSAPFLFLSTLSARQWGHGNILGVFVYFGAMFLYSLLLTLVLFNTYKILRKAITWKHRNKVIVHHPTGFSNGGQ